MSAGRTSGRSRHRLHRNIRTAVRPMVDTTNAVLVPPQLRAERLGAQGYSKFIGRVGALAVALGVGVGFTTSMPAIAWADDTDTSSSTESSSPNSTSDQAGTRSATDTTASTTASTSTVSTDSPPDTSTSDEDSSADALETGDRAEFGRRPNGKLRTERHHAELGRRYWRGAGHFRRAGRRCVNGHHRHRADGHPAAIRGSGPAANPCTPR